MSTPADQHAVEVRVTGRVQAVSFRYSCVLQAERLGVRGWVRNEPDGSVCGHFEGSATAVDALVRWCRSGPPSARVDQVLLSPVTVGGFRGFEVR